MYGNESDTNATGPLQLVHHAVHWGISDVLLLLLIILVVFGNCVVILTVLLDGKLKAVTTNKFIASLAVSDLLVGLVVMPLSLHSKVNNDEWTLGYRWCQFHLVSGVFSTTASIVHLVAISIDRYFAIMFPTEYQRHSVSTSTLPYLVMIWLMALAVSSTLFMEGKPQPDAICWIDNPQYIVLSSLLSFFLPGAIVVYLYVQIFNKLRNHQLYMFGQLTLKNADKKQSLPRVIIEEVRSRRGSRLSQTGSQSGSPTRRPSYPSKERSPSQPEIHSVAMQPQRWRSPTICAETLAHDRCTAAKKRVSIVPDPPSMDVSANFSCIAQIQEEHEHNKLREQEMRCGDYSIHKKSEEELRRLSLDRRASVLQRRRISTQDCPNGLPIMQAFQKAYHDIQCGRRRSVQSFEIVYNSSRPHEECSSLIADNVQSLEQPLSSEKASFKSIFKKSCKREGKSVQRLLLDATLCKNHSRPLSYISPPTFLMVPAMMGMNTPPQSPTIRESNYTLQVPRLFDCPSPCSVPSNSSHSSYTSGSSAETLRRISMNSYGSSLTDNTDSTFEVDSRRSSAWSTIRNNALEAGTGNQTASAQRKISSISRGKLKKIATQVISKGLLSAVADHELQSNFACSQVTRAIRRKRRESMAIRRESRATRVVAAILVAFLICWIPYFCVGVVRGVAMGLAFQIDVRFHLQLYVVTTWLGYTHSCSNPLIYMCLNKNFRSTLRKVVHRVWKR